MKDSAISTGLFDAGLIKEPSACLMAYGMFDRSYHPNNYLIIRIGSYTTDFSMINLRGEYAEILNSVHLN
jgi:molecular chaperone DnaK (HSP70)